MKFKSILNRTDRKLMRLDFKYSCHRLDSYPYLNMLRVNLVSISYIVPEQKCAHRKHTTWAESESHKSASYKTADDTPAFFKAANTQTHFFFTLSNYLYVVSIISKTDIQFRSMSNSNNNHSYMKIRAIITFMSQYKAWQITQHWTMIFMLTISVMH